MTASINFLNVDEGILNNEGNTHGVISVPVIEITFENYYIHISHDI